MLLYSYDPETRVYTGCRQAQIDPLESQAAGTTVYVRPGAKDTTTKPPATGPKQVAVWNGAMWAIVADHRGETWWKDHATQVAIDKVGVPTGLSPTRPAPPIEVARDEAWAEIKGALMVKRLDIADARGEANELKGALALNAKDDTRPTERDEARRLLDAYAASRGESGWEETAAKIIAARTRWASRTMALEMLEDGAWRTLQSATTADQCASIQAQVIGAVEGV